MKVRWTEAAARRLQEIHAFVARDDAAAADRLATALLVYRIHGRAVEVLTVFEGHRLLRAEEVG